MKAVKGDVRFTVPLYTTAEAGRYVGVSSSTFRTWVNGYRRDFPDRQTVTGKPLITGLASEVHGGPSIPFGGLAEGIFLSALRRAGVPLQQIRPALELVRTKIGVEHALASKQLYVAGAQLLWEVSRKYLKCIEYDDNYARRVRLPQYEVADIAADPEINFGRPYFTATGTPLYAVRGLIKAGESIEDVAADFELPIDQITEVVQREGLLISKWRFRVFENSI